MDRGRSTGCEHRDNSVGIWAFGPAGTCLVPLGYHHEVAKEPMPHNTRRVCEGLDDPLDGDHLLKSSLDFLCLILAALNQDLSWVFAAFM